MTYTVSTPFASGLTVQSVVPGQGPNLVRGARDTLADVQSEFPSGTDGLWIIDGGDDSAVWDGDEWVRYGPVRGPQGDTGPPGPDGDDGADGADGERGPQGLTGPPGEDGADGGPGPAGLSAFELAVEDGFVGNFDAWRASLQGAKGDKGDTGNTGAVGPEGPEGPEGPQGEIGVGTSGWGSYQDGQYTAGSPLTIAADTDTVLPNNAASTLETYKPENVATFYDGTVITGVEGEARLLTFEFQASTSSASGAILELWMDIGGAVGPLYRGAVTTFPKGNNVQVGCIRSLGVYTLDTWETNGATVYVRSNVDVDIWDIRFVIHRLANGEDGLSAYELAQVEDGFVGTYEEWRDTLVGPEGPAGGVDTVNGSDGDVTLDADDIEPTATRLYLTSDERTKLAGVEEGATAGGGGPGAYPDSMRFPVSATVAPSGVYVQDVVGISNEQTINVTHIDDSDVATVIGTLVIPTGDTGFVAATGWTSQAFAAGTEQLLLDNVTSPSGDREDVDVHVLWAPA